MVKKILYAEDSRTVRELVKKLMEIEFPGHVVESFNDGTSLDKRLIDRTTNDICLVLTDNQMPGIEGMGIIKKHARRLSSIPFILYYGGDEEIGKEEIGKEAIRNGAYFYVVKPNYKDLFKILGKILS